MWQTAHRDTHQGRKPHPPRSRGTKHRQDRLERHRVEELQGRQDLMQRMALPAQRRSAERDNEIKRFPEFEFESDLFHPTIALLSPEVPPRFSTHLCRIYGG